MTDFIKIAKQVLSIEADAVNAMRDKIDQDFVDACEIILQCRGRLIVVGIGKSGHIGNKIAATFASTGTPSFFVHPSEASHGDLGMITPHDAVLAISNSGETPEILTILPALAMGDALAMATLEAREFDESDFARSHPGGALGKRLLLYVDDIMHKDDNIPLVDENASLEQALIEMSEKALGVTGVVNTENELTRLQPN